ncbi:hypothetical protein P0L94_03550 [Microbacter sp. GSS18]|nr:hypothetical protein P0L94_03550 [Microbacter sp. GSS18]
MRTRIASAWGSVLGGGAAVLSVALVLPVDAYPEAPVGERAVAAVCMTDAQDTASTGEGPPHPPADRLEAMAERDRSESGEGEQQAGLSQTRARYFQQRESRTWHMEIR